MVLDNRSKNIVRKKFSKMGDSVTLLYLHNRDKDECPYCEATKMFLEEISQLSDGKLHVKVYEVGSDDTSIFGVDEAPVIKFEGYNIRYLGAPVGQETWAFLDTIVMASNKAPKLGGDSQAQIRRLNRGVHIEVIVTPTCPYCPYAALLANSMAIANSHVASDVVEAYEFPEISEQYGVTAVPTIAINGKVAFVGLPPEDRFVQAVVEGKVIGGEYEHVSL